ncbi:pyridoxine 5'-phosphate synthase [Teichococcus vastitatis]|uniref:Pyridoxine 5'-phosphate synthase n=1 Tax=Teichococcus vastitatis TaxID=2307076 RepID=A0ABS9W9J2_9PROT|nr:pyridoxine 5'-phosphate synthase [Pseudoroseomonas vastitatis]MCI0755969.1 pyridoxine 5'-phosphate synthase [Pseudoroseomonas vastitatis]
MTPPPPPLRLSVNVDHVATLRNARGGQFPDPLEAARLCLQAGADGITIHLREDRRHIRDDDLRRIGAEPGLRLNFEMAATEEMVGLATTLRPAACCLVPEKRAELTTEGGLDVRGAGGFLGEAVGRLAAAGIEVSVFVEADPAQIEAAAVLGAQAVELHTGRYAEASPADRPPLLAHLRDGARAAEAAGLFCHAGHGLDFTTVRDLAALPQVVEVSIGHFLISQAVFEGLPSAVQRMREAIRIGRASISS